MGKYQGVEWVDHMIYIGLTISETSKLFSKMVPFYTPINKVWQLHAPPPQECLLLSVSLILFILYECAVISHYGFELHFYLLIIFFICLFAIHTPPFVKICLNILSYFVGLFISLYYRHLLYILDTCSFSDICIRNTLSQSAACLFIFFMVSFKKQTY